MGAGAKLLVGILLGLNLFLMEALAADLPPPCPGMRGGIHYPNLPPNNPEVLSFKFNCVAMDANNPTPYVLGAHGCPTGYVPNRAYVPDGMPVQEHLTGHATGNFKNLNGHLHMEIQLEGTAAPYGLIEVIYNTEFGPTPKIFRGMPVEACGEYITSNSPFHDPNSGKTFPASPDGAIIHWVHINPPGNKHDPGFLFMGGVLCGQDAADAPPHHHRGGQDRNRRRNAYSR